MIFEEAVMLFRRLGVDVQVLSREEFNVAYHRLAQRYHPDISPSTHELMANINAARATVLKSHRRLVYDASTDEYFRSGEATAW